MVAERLTAQLLAGTPARSPEAVAERLLAVQAQDLRGARLAIRARSSGPDAAAVDSALDSGSLVVSWLNRGTLHMVRGEDHGWLHMLTTPQLRTGNLRRLAQEGVTADLAERGVAIVERAVAANGPQTRGQLREQLDREGVPTAGQALVHVLMLATLRGLVLRGPVVGREQAYVLVRDWLGEQRQPDSETALAELARRYLAGHGPADDRDLARWAGVTLRDARAGLGAIARELRQRPDGLVDLASRASPAKLPPPRLLGAYEPLLLGWTSRTPILGVHREVVTTNGLFRPFALVRGKGVALWRMKSGRLELEPFRPVSSADRSALEADGEELLGFLG